MKNFEDFFLAAFGNFTKCNVPKRKPNHISISTLDNKVSSRYWYGTDSFGDYVIRLSNHWGNVATCRWLLEGSTENTKSPVAGKIYLSTMKDHNSKKFKFNLYKNKLAKLSLKYGDLTNIHLSRSIRAVEGVFIQKPAVDNILRNVYYYQKMVIENKIARR